MATEAGRASERVIRWADVNDSSYDFPVRAQAFISCGQRPDERGVAAAVAKAVAHHNIRPYVAVAAQSIQDVNSSIIGQLRRSDYYIFIDLRRDPLPSVASRESPRYRGSLFSHQELAIAYELGFERVLFFRQNGVLLEGMSAYITSNAIPFEDAAEVPILVSEELTKRGWNEHYSRNLVVENLTWSPVNTIIRYGELLGRFLYIDIVNRRPDTGALGTVVRLAFITDPSGKRAPSPIRSHLKVTGHAARYDQTIWPLSHGAVDLLCVGVEQAPRLFLNTSLDVPQSPIITQPGEYVLEYEVFAQGFPVTEFAIKLSLVNDPFLSSAELLSRAL